MSVNAFAGLIAKLASNPEADVQWCHGVVAAVHAANPPVRGSVDVTILGVTVTDLAYLRADTLIVGDEVELLVIGASTPVLLVLGACA